MADSADVSAKAGRGGLAAIVAASRPSAAIAHPMLASSVELPLATSRSASSLSTLIDSGTTRNAARSPGATRFDRLST